MRLLYLISSIIWLIIGIAWIYNPLESLPYWVMPVSCFSISIKDFILYIYTLNN